MINREQFYKKIKPLFAKLSQDQVNGINALLDEWEGRGLTDLRQLSYILATVYHETGKAMQPIKEKGGEAYLKSKSYYPYYGRDLVQTTWKVNYERVKKFSGIDVVTNPDLIADLNLAVKVAIEFMLKGYYTGKKLSDYFNATTEDWKHARKIINGLDKADLVASYAKVFHEAVT